LTAVPSSYSPLDGKNAWNALQTLIKGFPNPDAMSEYPRQPNRISNNPTLIIVRLLLTATFAKKTITHMVRAASTTASTPFTSNMVKS
jgi:hypothetical protein